MGMSVLVPQVSADEEYAHRVRHFDWARVAVLENLPRDFDRATLSEQERQIVEAFRHTDEYRTGVFLRQGSAQHHQA